MNWIVRTGARISAFILRCLLSLSLALAPKLAVSGAKADELTFELRIERGHVPANMRLIRVKQGDVVKLRWSSDRSIALHLHGYDIERKIEPGVVAEMTFTARATGRPRSSRSPSDTTRSRTDTRPRVPPSASGLRSSRQRRIARSVRSPETTPGR